MFSRVGFYFPVQSFNFLAKKSVIMQWMHYKLIYHLDFIRNCLPFPLANFLLCISHELICINLALFISFEKTGGQRPGLTVHSVRSHCPFRNCCLTRDRDINTGKKLWLVKNGHWGPLGLARIKSRTIFLNFRKFPIFWAQKLSYFVKKKNEKLRLTVAYPH